jgi:hypothetical protein
MSECLIRPGYALLLLAAIMLAPGLTYGQAVRGVVVEDGTGKPVADATVELKPWREASADTVRTDSLGVFEFQPGRAGAFSLHVMHADYPPLDSDTVSLAPGETLTLELRLARTAIPLEPLIVKARARDRFGGFYERAGRPGFGRFLTREDLGARSRYRTTDLLRGMPGVYVVYSRGRGGIPTVNLVTMRGVAGPCLPAIYVDGMPMQQMPESGVDEFLVPDMIEGVEVYTSFAGVPARFSSLNACGLVAFWTREDTKGPWSWWKLAAGVGGFLLGVFLARWW